MRQTTRSENTLVCGYCAFGTFVSTAQAGPGDRQQRRRETGLKVITGGVGSVSAQDQWSQQTTMDKSARRHVSDKRVRVFEKSK